MTVATEVLAVRVLDITADTPVPVTFPLYSIDEAFVYYGNNSLLAQYNVDYTITLGTQPNFNTFTFTPKASLIAKINVLIAAGENESNFVTIRRNLEFKTASTPSSVANTTFTSREFDRVTMKLQQIRETLLRSVVLPPTFVGERQLQLPAPQAGKVLIWSDDERDLVNGPDGGAIANAEVFAQTVIDLFDQTQDATVLRFAVGADVQSINIGPHPAVPQVYINGVLEDPIRYTRTTSGIITSIDGDWPISPDPDEPFNCVVWITSTRVLTKETVLQSDPSIVLDVMGAGLVAGSNITLSIDETTKRITISSTGGGGGASGGTFNPLTYGALGNGLASEAVADRTGLQAAIDALPSGRTLDLLGRNYVIDRPLVFPSGDWHQRGIFNGSIYVTDDFDVSGNGAMFDFSNTNAYALYISFVRLFGNKSDGFSRAKKGMLFAGTQELHVLSCAIFGCTEISFHHSSTEYGRQSWIENCHFCGNFGAERIGTTSVGLRLDGGDHNVRNCTLREHGAVNLLCKLGANSITGCHIYSFDSPSTVGVILEQGNHCEFDGNYLDSQCVVMDGYFVDGGIGSPAFISACSVHGGRMQTHPGRDMPVDFAFIVLRPRSAGVTMHGLLVTDVKFQKNRGGQPDINPVKVDTSFGTINANAIFQSHMVDNTFHGVIQKTTRPRAEGLGTATQNFPCSFASLIPWGTIQRTLSSTFQSSTGGVMWWTGGVDKVTNQITIFTSANVTGRSIIVADTNADAI